MCFSGITAERRERLSALLADEKAQVTVRLYGALAVTCQRKGVGCPAVLGTIRDLGDSGACGRLPESLAPGTKVGLRTASLFGPIAVDAQVVWADPPPVAVPRTATGSACSGWTRRATWPFAPCWRNFGRRCRGGWSAPRPGGIGRDGARPAYLPIARNSKGSPCWGG